jgi:hypothetical protein
LYGAILDGSIKNEDLGEEKYLKVILGINILFKLNFYKLKFR